MKLVERYIEFNNWPTSRKTFLLMAIAVIAHLLLTPLTLYFMRASGLVRNEVLTPLILAGLLICVLCGFVGWLLDRVHKEGRWSAFLVIALYGGWLAAVVVTMGIWTTPFLGWPALMIILIGLWYDQFLGWFGLGVFVLMIVCLAILIVSGILPFAPGMLAQDLASQNSASWAIAALTPFFGFFLYAFLLSQLSVSARNLQDRRLAQAQKLIRRYAPDQIAEKILSGEHVEDAAPERRKLTIFFSDVEGFTTTSDELDPEDLSAVLDEYFSEMAQIADKYGTSINQFVGDGIMIFFGAPHNGNDEDLALKAVKMALDMQQRLLELQDVWLKRGIRKPLRARMGINTGYASVGDFGSPGRKVYTAIGMQANIAARIQAHCEPGKLLISDTTWALVKDKVEVADKGELEFKGVHYPVRVYAVLGLAS